ncbi:MAG: acyltransferase [Syntrophus sp. (in: bacteria)]|nr:acyltransferase [Syntrophus sp. (in: bacteria)]
MSYILSKTLIGVISSLMLSINTLFWSMIIFFFALLKLLLPFKPVRILIDRILNGLATNWISCNSGWMRLTQKIRWDVQGLDGLQYENWYLVNTNHQSWVDIFVLQHLLNRKIPFLKFLIKRQLIYVPVIGLAWWALDFPFVRRYSREYLEKHPNMRGKDLETTRKACDKFARIPTSVMNFPEGTRFSTTKQDKQKSPYRYLLKPKAGGIALAMESMGHKFQSLLDVTIVYPDGVPRFWDFLCGVVKRITVRIQHQQIPTRFIDGDYENNAKFREAFQQWLYQLWLEKDERIGQLLAEKNPASISYP